MIQGSATYLPQQAPLGRRRSRNPDRDVKTVGKTCDNGQRHVADDEVIAQSGYCRSYLALAVGFLCESML